MKITLLRMSLHLSFMLSMLNANAYDFEVDGMFYNVISLPDLTCEVTYKDGNYNTYSGDIVIPSIVTYSGKTFSVTSIGNDAFQWCFLLSSVTIPNSVVSIGASAFDGCYDLTSVTIPTSVTLIYNGAFCGCSSLTSVTIPSSITSIDDSVFKNCHSLISVNIPNSVTSIGMEAFSSCYGLTSVNIPNSVTSINHSAFAYCSNLSSIIIPNSVKLINYGAFSECSALTSVIISESVTTIGSWAFSNCSSLKEIISLAYTPPNIDSSTFYGVSKAETIIKVPNGSVTDYQAADYWKEFWSIFPMDVDVTSVTLNKTDLTLKLGNSEKLTATVSPANASCQTITWSSSDYSIATVDADGNVIAINPGNATITASCILTADCYITVIDSYLGMIFALNSDNSSYSITGYTDELLSDMVIPSLYKGLPVTSIGENAFSDCTALTSVTIPKSVTKIGNSAFNGCTSLNSLTSEITDLDNLNMGSNVFYNVPTSTCVLSVSRLTSNLYQTTATWSDFVNIVEHFITGDANIDYGVSVADVSTTINYIIGTNTATFDEEAADVNCNGKVNVADATLITNIILSQPSSAFAMPARKAAMFEQTANTCLSMTDLAKDELEAQVSIKDASDFVALQFEVSLPEGLTLEKVSTDAYHTAAMYCIGNNTYRVIIYSLDNKPFESNEVATFTFSSTGNVEIGAEINFTSVLVNENIGGRINEYGIPAYPAYVKQTSGIKNVTHSVENIRVKNGELLIDAECESTVNIISIDGKVITKQLVSGTNRLSLPKGVYIVNGKKVIL